MKTPTEVTAQSKPLQPSASLILAGAKDSSQRPVQQAETRRQQTLNKLRQVLPEKVSNALEEKGFSGALNALQNDLNDTERAQFAQTLENLSGKKLPTDPKALKSELSSSEFANKFIATIKSLVKSAENSLPDNPSRSHVNEFARAQIAKLSQDPTKAPVQARQAQETAKTILSFPTKRDAAQSISKAA